VLESNSKCKRVYLRPESADLRSESADLRPMGHDGEGGDKSLDRQSKKQTQVLCFLQHFGLFGAAAQTAKLKFFLAR